MANDFLDDDINFPYEEDYSGALDIFNKAIKEGNTDRLILSENELVFVIDSYMDSDELDSATLSFFPKMNLLYAGAYCVQANLKRQEMLFPSLKQRIFLI